MYKEATSGDVISNSDVLHSLTLIRNWPIGIIPVLGNIHMFESNALSVAFSAFGTLACGDNQLISARIPVQDWVDALGRCNLHFMAQYHTAVPKL